MNERVAAILVNYESGDDLAAALTSLLSLDRPPDAFIVVDNASRDDSLRGAERVCPGLLIIRNKENGGFAKGVNQGISAARTIGATHVWIFNPDARARSSALSALIEYSHRYPKAMFSPVIFDRGGNVWFSGGNINFFRMRAVHRDSLEASGLSTEEFLTGCALFVPWEIIDRIGGFDERFFLYYEDADYSVRARAAGYDLRIVPESGVDHAEISQENAKKTYYLVYSGLSFFFKYAYGWRRPYLHIYVTIRRLKNWLDCLLFGGKEALSVRRAYGDFFRKTHDSEIFADHG